MDEIFRLCDRVTVLRDGETIGTREVAATDRAELIRMMVGSNIEASGPLGRGPRPGRWCSRSAHLTTHKLRNVSFELSSGEVLGVAGLVGAGRSELGAALFGLDPILSGTLRLKAKPFAPWAPRRRWRRTGTGAGGSQASGPDVADGRAGKQHAVGPVPPQPFGISCSSARRRNCSIRWQAGCVSNAPRPRRRSEV